MSKEVMILTNFHLLNMTQTVQNKERLCEI